MKGYNEKHDLSFRLFFRWYWSSCNCTTSNIFLHCNQYFL